MAAERTRARCDQLIVMSSISAPRCGRAFGLLIPVRATDVEPERRHVAHVAERLNSELLGLARIEIFSRDPSSFGADADIASEPLAATTATSSLQSSAAGSASARS